MRIKKVLSVRFCCVNHKIHSNQILHWLHISWFIIPFQKYTITTKQNILILFYFIVIQVEPRQATSPNRALWSRSWLSNFLQKYANFFLYPTTCRASFIPNLYFSFSVCRFITETFQTWLFQARNAGFFLC